MQKSTVIFKNKPRIVSTSTIVGNKEKNGPLGEFFHRYIKNDVFGQDTFEKAERKMLEAVINDTIKNAPLQNKEVDIIYSGDLINQIISSSFTARSFNTSFFGIFGACSTMAEALALASMAIDGKYFTNAVCSTCSHFGSVERQFRFPLELGTQRTPTAQWTVTGAGAAILSLNGEGPRIRAATIGKVVDYGICDANNMGAAMAPAARDTILTFLNESNVSLRSIDMILTGDLGALGSSILIDLMREKNIYIEDKHSDCGKMIYRLDKDNFQGGSGAGCSASVLNSYIYKLLREKSLKNVLFVATGALMNSLTNQQGDSIPAIAHAVFIEA